MDGRFFAVEEFSAFDGPGIRVAVFLKGCPLGYTWCHHPEGQRIEVDFLRSPNACTGCGTCLQAGQEENGRPSLTEGSVAACPHSLVRCAGRDDSAQALSGLILKSARVLSMNGCGVMFSGGDRKMAQLVIIFIDLGGHQIQINAINRDRLLDA